MTDMEKYLLNELIATRVELELRKAAATTESARDVEVQLERLLLKLSPMSSLWRPLWGALKTVKNGTVTAEILAVRDEVRERLETSPNDRRL